MTSTDTATPRSADPDATVVAAALRGYRFRFTDELTLHTGLAAALERAGLVFEREVVLARTDRIDFLVDQVGIEVKVAGQLPQVVRQLRRYAASDRVSELLLVTTRAAHRAVPARIDGVPVSVLYLSSAFS